MYVYLPFEPRRTESLLARLSLEPPEDVLLDVLRTYLAMEKGLGNADAILRQLRVEHQGLAAAELVAAVAGEPSSAGLGNDTLRSRSPASSLLGGPGDDFILYTGSASVRLRGGAGKDTLDSSSGQLTTFVVGAGCELVAGERWRSTGPARIESPVSLNAIQSAGVILQLGSPVTFVSTPVLSDKECF